MADAQLRTLFRRALDETRVHLEKVGIRPDTISVTGIPIDPIFAKKKDKYEMRTKHGLEKDKLTIIVSAGGFGVGKISSCFLKL